MSGVVHSLSASITSALAVKPSTVYVMRVENTETRNVWHLRRCFSEFCDLRERMLVLIDGGSVSGAAASSGTVSTAAGSAQNSPTTATTVAMRLLALNPSLRGGSTPSSTTNSPRSTSSAGSGPMQERFPYLYTKFPRRQFFGSRTKKVIEKRTLALNQFLQEALWFMREVKTQHNIAMYFSLMTQLEAFFDCAKRAAKGAPSPPPSGATAPNGLCPSFYALSPQTKAHNSSPQLVPAVPFSTVPSTRKHTRAASPTRECAAKDAADRARAVAARGFCHAPHGSDESDEEADDYEERKLLKRPISCFMSHEVRERRVSNPASQFAAALQSRASERDAVISAADAWAARIEIAGIPPAEALRRRNSKNQAMLVKQYSSPVLSTKSTGLSERGDTRTTTIYGLEDRSPHLRRQCRA